MAITTFSGPIKAGTIRNTTGTTAGTNMQNTGFVVMSQQVQFAFGDEGAVQNTTAVIPANSQIIDIKINVETAFNDTGADVLDIGVVGDSDLYVNDADISATGSLALGATALCANWLDVGATDVQIAFIYNGANNDASAGAGTFTIMYAQNINITA
jgi:hypothetical protein|tara:strand:+ start:1054 stop:1521 length:468 start_codon:yes stop_codon:yes gene_type:complete